jgi:hypothetical protein
MAPDERDRRFDKALARHLRSAAPSEGAANAPADSALPRDPCPDVETLAAYHERSLFPVEMNSWKAHIVGCVHCQNILSQLELTDSIPVQAAREEEIPAAQERNAAIAEAPAAPAARTRAPRITAGPRWRWLAPAGAIAASLLVWIALHENQQPRPSNQSEVKLAKNEPPPAPPSVSSQAPAATPPAQQPAPADRLHATLTKPQSAADEISSSNARAVSGAPRTRQELGYAAKAVPANPPADKEAGTRKDSQLKAAEEQRREANQVDLDAKAVGGAVQEKVELQAQAPPAPSVQSQNQNQYNYNVQKAPGPAPMGQAESAKKMKAAPSAPSPAAVAGAKADYRDTATLMLAGISSPGLISAPGSHVLWRAGRAGLIEFSADGGKSWSRQTSGVLLDLLSGSAPSEKVCWIVGRVGTILLSTDGGAHWKLLPSPLNEDLGAVHAADALHATIWKLHNTQSFETTDGGLTWKRVGKE